MSIFILEDDVTQAVQLKNVIKGICEQFQVSYDFIHVTSKYEEIIEKIPRTNFVPIYFLDIEIKEEERKGLQVAQEIRRHDTEGILVFVTTHANFAPISYQYMVSALTFIDKGLPFKERNELVKQSLLHYESHNQRTNQTEYFVVENQHTTIRVPFETVLYIMTDGPHRLALVTTNRTIQFYGTLKDIEQMDKPFLRCHQSYLVNTEKIFSYDGASKSLLLKSKEMIPVSRRMGRTVRQLLKGE